MKNTKQKILIIQWDLIVVIYIKYSAIISNPKAQNNNRIQNTYKEIPIRPLINFSKALNCQISAMYNIYVFDLMVFG